MSLNLMYSGLRENHPEIGELYHSFNLTKTRMITSLTRGEENEYGRIANGYDVGAKAIEDAKAVVQTLREKSNADREKLWLDFNGDSESVSLTDAKLIMTHVNKMSYDEALDSISENQEIRSAMAKYTQTFGIKGVTNALEYRAKVFNLMHTQRLQAINDLEEALPNLLQSFESGVQTIVSENSMSNWENAKRISEGRYDGDQ